MPDCIERKIYFNVINLILGLIDETTSNTEIQVLGHSIKFYLQPTENHSNLKL